MVELDSPGRKKENVLVYAEGPVGNVAEPGRGTILATVVLQEVPELELMGLQIDLLMWHTRSGW